MNSFTLFAFLILSACSLILALPHPPNQPPSTTLSPNFSERQPQKLTLNKRIICEVKFTGQYPKEETKALAIRDDAGAAGVDVGGPDGRGPCRESDDDSE